MRSALSFGNRAKVCFLSSCDGHYLDPSISDIPSNWQNLSLLLSPWRLGATAIVLQFILKHMSRELSQEDSNKAVNSRLDELTLAIFRQPMTSKEAYFVAQMTKDVGNDIAGKVMRSLIVCNVV
jgi:hypothetical protein